MIPISRENIEYKPFSNIFFVNSIEEFEKIELEKNETRLALDNFKQCFYTRSRDKNGEYGTVKVYFYDDFATRMQNDSDKVFYEKCKILELDKLKTEIAYKFFIENAKTMSVWLWLLETKKSDMEYDSVKHLKYKLKKAFLSLEIKN